MDYAIPKATMAPWMECSHTETPSPVNPLGVKGVGEAGTIGCSPAVVNSVVDALSHLGVKHIDMPLTLGKDLERSAARRQAMISQNFEYSAPASLEEALDLLAGDGARVLAGGMSLVPLMKLRLAAPERLVDLRRLRELSFIREDGDAIRIGAMTTHYSLESSLLLHDKCRLLAETAGSHRRRSGPQYGHDWRQPRTC